jgi:hypothetical protein
MINFSSKFLNVTSLTGDYVYDRNQANLMLYVDYVSKDGETGIDITFSTINPEISSTDFYKIVEKDPTTNIVDDLVIKVQSIGKVIIPIPVPYQTSNCRITIAYDGMAGAGSVINLDVDRDTLRYV